MQRGRANRCEKKSDLNENRPHRMEILIQNLSRDVDQEGETFLLLNLYLVPITQVYDTRPEPEKKILMVKLSAPLYHDTVSGCRQQ